MNNYEAIMQMSREQLEDFLDDVYCTGLNTGVYASRQPEEQEEKILGEKPFDGKWLSDNAEPATLCKAAEDGDTYLLKSFVKALLRNAEIDVSKMENEPK